MKCYEVFKINNYEITQFYSGVLYGSAKRSVVVMRSGNIHAFQGDMPKCTALWRAQDKEDQWELLN